MQLAWGNKVSQEFRDRVIGISEAFGWSEQHDSWLMACMAFESGESFSPSVRNAAGSGAVGLIQFMPATAHYLGTTTQELAALTAEQQLQWVAMYFRPYASRILSLSDMYMAILMPKYIGAADNAVLFTDGTIAFKQNSGLDSSHDGKITKLEAASRVQAKLEKGLLPEYVWVH